MKTRIAQQIQRVRDLTPTQRRREAIQELKADYLEAALLRRLKR